MNRRSVKHTLTMTCLMLVLLASLLLGATSIFSIRNTTNMALTEYESAMDSGYNTEIKSEVQTVIAVLQAEYDKSQAGELTEEEAKAEAKEIVRAMRYRDDGSGYFWIDDTDYNLVMHPILAGHCNKCKSKCPYGLDTPALLAKNYEDYKRVLAGEVSVK